MRNISKSQLRSFRNTTRNFSKSICESLIEFSSETKTSKTKRLLSHKDDEIEELDSVMPLLKSFGVSVSVQYQEISKNTNRINAKQINFLVALFCSCIFLSSCKSEASNNGVEKITNNGKVGVLNGKGEKDSIEFRCSGCKENIHSFELFNLIIDEARELTINTLNFPLSFDPKNIEVTIIKEDSLYYFDNNIKIENVFRAITKYNYIAKNTYGTELEGEALNTFFLLDGKISDLENEIKLTNLQFEDGYINRTLSGFEKNSEFIEFIALKDKSIIVKSSVLCVDEGSSFQIILENEDAIQLRSWNDFNCDGTSYFNWFGKSQIEKLLKSKIKYLYLYSRGESVMVTIPKNMSDYFQQLIKLY